MAFASISVIIPTYNRVDKLQISLQRILACEPSPAEVIVHVDAGDTQTAGSVRSTFAEVRVIESTVRLGPGGGRNRLIAAASYPLVASFDDDSYPVDTDYFIRLKMIFDEFPSAAVLAATIFYDGEALKADLRNFWVSDFVGCGCAYRRETFLRTKGFVPLPVAYGMEEVDLSLQLHHLGCSILRSGWLRVRHETARQRREHPAVTGATIANLLLLTYLRYPRRLWWIGLAQVVRSVAWLLLHGRRRGILAGFCQAPRLLRKFASYRAVIPARVVRYYLRFRHHPIAVGDVLGQKRNTSSGSS